MSLERIQTVQPSHFEPGEGYQDWIPANPANSGRGPNDRRSSHRHGGVGGRGMRVLVKGVRNEISPGGRHGPTAGPSGQTARPVWPGEKSERPVVATKAGNAAGAKGPHSVDENSEATFGEGSREGNITAKQKLECFNELFCRQAKEGRRWSRLSKSRTVNNPGKPDAGNPPVRFDEGREPAGG